MGWIDSHAHLTSEELLPFVPELLVRAKAAGCGNIVNICTDRKTLEEGLKLSKEYPWVVNTGATTPHDVEKEGEELLPLFTQAAQEGKLVAVGETGLDYYYEHSDRTLQKDFCVRYMQLARSCQLPLVIHCREAFADLFTLLDTHFTENGKMLPGVLHCFTGTAEEARGVIERGWYLSLSGIVTFKKSIGLQEVAKWVPLEQLLIETDAPYLAPQLHRGKQNEPSYLPETAGVIAALKGIPVEKVLEVTASNARNLFQI